MCKYLFKISVLFLHFLMLFVAKNPNIAIKPDFVNKNIVFYVIENKKVIFKNLQIHTIHSGLF